MQMIMSVVFFSAELRSDISIHGIVLFISRLLVNTKGLAL